MSESDSGSFIVYKSSAGSGKTFTLVREYLRLILQQPETFRNILAITFTNKAANEMKSRIISTLRVLASGDTVNQRADIRVLSEELSKATGLSPGNLTERATAALRLILHDYSAFSVGTIDSFVHRLVRIFARDLGLPPSFEVELEKEKLITKTVDLLISKVGIDPELTSILVNYINERMEDELPWNIISELKEFTGKIIDEDSYLSLRKLRHLKPGDFIKISEKLRLFTKQFENQLYQIARSMFNLLIAQDITPAAVFQGSRGIWNYLERICRKDFSETWPNQYALKTLREHRWKASGIELAHHSAFDRILPQLKEYSIQLTELLDHNYENYLICRLVQRNIFQMAVLSEIEKVMAEFRENENLVHISEFNKRIAEIIQKEPVPYIYERIGNRYHHFMIDEFQDTSVLQWHNLLPLLENSLGYGYLNMIVGDGKQAIYRWRNGEVAQFAALPEIYLRQNDPLSLQREKLLKQQFSEKYLERNFRSKPVIVDFNNQFFEFARQFLNESLQNIYHNHWQLHHPAKSGGYIRVEFLRDGDETDEPGVDSPRLKRLVEIVRECLVCYPPEQITILTRTNQQAGEVASCLLRHHISVVSSEALLLNSSPHVSLIIALLRLMNNPSDLIAATSAITLLYQMGYFGKIPLHSILSGCREVVPDQSDARSLEDLLLSAGFHYSPGKLSLLSLFDRVELIIDGLKLDPFGENPYLNFFLDLLYHETSKRSLSLNDFLVFWDEKGWKKSVIIPEGTPSVRVMTIHKAKGLEFPVVIIPFPVKISGNTLKDAWIEPNIPQIPQLTVARIPLSRKLKNTYLADLYDQETEKSFLDLLNLMYVAMTRAENRLYILSKDKTNPKGEWKSSSPRPDDADLLYHYLSKNHQKNKQGEYEIGKFDEKPFSISSAPVPAKEKSLKIRSNWRNKILLRSSPLSATSDGVREPLVMGNIFHRLMSLIIVPEDIDRALHVVIREGLATPSEADLWRVKINQILQQEDVKYYFQEGLNVYNEKEILLPDGKVLRPDRIVMDENQVHIIDYKTGDPSPEHQRQMDEYREAMLQAGFRNVQTRLIYFSF